MRLLGTAYRTVWLVHQKLMAAMAECDAHEPLAGDVQYDDADLGGEHPVVGGLSSPNKVPIVVAVSTNDAGRPTPVKFSAIGSFTREAVANWAKADLLPDCDVRSDGLSCFAGVIDADCAHSLTVVGQSKTRDRPQFTWLKIILGNLKARIGGGYKAFRLNKYANHYLGAFAYRFNHRVNLKWLLQCLIGITPTCPPSHGPRTPDQRRG